MRDIAIERDEEGTAVRMWIGRDTAATVSGACRRPSCNRSVPPQRLRRGYAKLYCSDACRSKHWCEQHPRVKMPEGAQARLDFTPAASDLAEALRSRETKAQRIVARLRQGKATTWELAQVGGVRFGARLNDLKAQGMEWEREDFADHSVYTMTQEPRGE